MDLETFIKTTLVQIVRGTEAAIDEIKGGNSHAFVNPIGSHTLHSNPKDVAFDVAVTTTDSTSGELGAGIRVASIQIGAKGEKAVESQAVSRVKFAIPIAIPGVPTEQYQQPAALLYQDTKIV